jgi:aromatic ring-opening dioxygenase LigB subunit
MSLVACYVAPHPPIIVPEVGGSSLSEVPGTVKGMNELAAEAVRLDLETIVILSPHAPLQPDKMGVLTGKSYAGSLAHFGVPEVSLQFRGDMELAEAIEREAADRGVSLGVRGAALTAPLDHGAIVPLYYVTSRMSQSPLLVELSFSFRSRGEHLLFGEAIGAAIDAHEKRVLYVASGDLSHRLTPAAPAGYNPEGAEFDRLVVEAFASGNLELLLEIPEGLQENAGECGYRSLVVLAGLLRGRRFITRVLAYEGPFGVGYLVGAVDLHGRAVDSPGLRQHVSGEG